MGPDNAARIYAKRHPEAKSFEVTLYGSLAATGKGDLFAAGGDVYEMHKIKDIMAWCKKTGHGYWEYVEMWCR
jgi:hypothetical protein